MKGLYAEELAELRVTQGSYHPETSSIRKPLSLLGPKEQRKEIASLEPGERAGAIEEGPSDRSCGPGGI